MGVAIPEEHGGAGMDTLSYALAIEEISAACASCGVIMSVNNSLFCDPVDKFGTDEQKSEVLGPVARGEQPRLLRAHRADERIDAQTMATAAEKVDGRLGHQRRQELDHQRPPRRLHPPLRRDRARRARSQAHRFSRPESGTPGFTQNAPDHKLGIHAAHSCTVFFENCKLPDARSSGTSARGSRWRWPRSTAGASASPARRSASRRRRSPRRRPTRRSELISQVSSVS